MMLALFKSKESRDFEKAMDFLESSRTLMSSAIETHRSILENNSNDFTELLELSMLVRQANVFLKKNLDPVSKKLEDWKILMQLQQPERYIKIERMVKNAEKNIRVAREKAVHIEHWVHFEISIISLFSEKDI